MGNKFRTVTQCDNCKFWKQGDPSARRTGNVGLCTVLLVQTDGFYDRNPNTPFWAQQLVRTTISWEGRSCPTYQPLDTVEVGVVGPDGVATVKIKK